MVHVSALSGCAPLFLNFKISFFPHPSLYCVRSPLSKMDLLVSPEVRLEMIGTLTHLTTSENILRKMPLEVCASRIEEGVGAFLLDETKILVVSKEHQGVKDFVEEYMKSKVTESESSCRFKAGTAFFSAKKRRRSDKS
jgi:hypothetical protein